MDTSKDKLLSVSIMTAAVILAGAWIYTARLNVPADAGALSADQIAALRESVIPAGGIVLPVVWGDLGKQMAAAGVIDQQKMEALYADRGGMDEASERLLTSSDNGNLKITDKNAPVVLNLLWALGLGNKDDILEKGPMTAPQYKGAGGFASTGGWTLAHGGAMDHYSRHSFVTLAPEQQALVERVAKGIYRPCCNNATHFPDCNHGMAMLGLLELMAAQGADEAAMYKTALQVNAFWFPDNYLTIAQFLKTKGISWDKADAKGVLGAEFSSASGYQQVLSQVQPVQKKGGGSCGV